MPIKPKQLQELETTVGEIGSLDQEMGQFLQPVVSAIKNLPTEEKLQEEAVQGIIEGVIAGAATMRTAAKKT